MLGHGMGIKALGLGLLSTLCLMGFAASVAHAANDWLVLNDQTEVNELVIMPLQTRSENDGPMGFKTTILKMNVEVICKKIEESKGALEAEGKTSGSYVFSECETLIKEKASPACKPAEPITMPFKGQTFVHGEKVYELISPASGKTFTTIVLGEECAVGNKFELTGTIVTNWCDNIEVYQLRHLMLVAGAALFSSGEHISALKFGAQEATLLGSIWKRLMNVDRQWKWMP